MLDVGPIPDSLAEADLCFDRIRGQGARMYSEWRDDGTVLVSWAAPGEDFNLEAVYDAHTGLLIQPPLLR